MTEYIKFSVIVPAYKAQFLAKCVDSILTQTYKNFELIIVNDNSPQNLDSIVKKCDDPRIRYYKNNVGFGAEHVVGNWNKCLDYATGDYIICMGDDDMLMPNCLEEYVKLIHLYPNLDLYHAMTLMIDESSKVIGVQSPRPIWESAYSMLYWRLAGRQQYIGDWLFKTATLRDNGGFYDLPFAWGSDDITTIIAAGSKGVANTFIPTFMYRINSQTISNNTSYTETKLKSIKETYDFFRKFLSEDVDNRLDKIYRQNLINSLGDSYSKSIAWNISADIKANPIHILKWLLKYNKKIIKHAIFYSLRK